MPAERRRVAVVLAAGKGTRMRSERPKVVHRVGGRPMLAWVVDTARRAGCDEVLVVVGHGADEVRAELADPGVTWVLQAEQRGTGHALAQAAPQLSGAATVVVLMGDAPLVTAETVEALAAAAEAGWGALAYADLDDAGTLGRVLLHPDGRFRDIVEHRDATAEQRRSGRANAGFYAFPAPDVLAYLDRLSPKNAQGELYLTDVPAMAVRRRPRGARRAAVRPARGLGDQQPPGPGARPRSLAVPRISKP